MDPALVVLAYFLPLIFLMAFIGNAGKKFIPYLFWGIFAAVPVLIVMAWIVPALPGMSDPEITITIAPVVEEFFKALPLVILALGGSRSTNRDVLVCALASGIGFSIAETGVMLNAGFVRLILPGSAWIVAAPSGLGLYDILARSFSTSLMHGCTCGIIGYGIVLVKNIDRKALPALLVGFYTIAVTIHAFYNLFYVTFDLPGLVIDLVLPITLFLFLLFCYTVDLPDLFRPAGTGDEEDRE
ncbi:MAG TPA: PrsW family glutamic-type intramembrane protease [Methanoregula sp.]|nr:PrsW family glutamic-type intramembrane protease [Methanoregula sp.]